AHFAGSRESPRLAPPRDLGATSRRVDAEAAALPCFDAGRPILRLVGRDVLVEPEDVLQVVANALEVRPRRERSEHRWNPWGGDFMRSYGRFVFVFVFALAATFALTSAQRNSARAATPSSGTLGPTGTSVTWDGFIAAAAASASEGTCVEGVNCDTFVLNVSGLPADWTGKVVDVRISWLNP